MRSATGRWVSGGDFFDREPELCILEQRVRDGNHVLLTGQRRMGKTSITRELGRRLTESGGWSSLFADVEDATTMGSPRQYTTRSGSASPGVLHHLQSLFARLREFAIMENRDRVPGCGTVADVEKVYRTGMLGPAGQNDLAHYETRLRDALDEESRSIAMEILAEAATQEAFTAGARTRLGEIYSRVVGDAQARITEVLDVLVHDGYLEPLGGDHRFPSRLLRDWWAARFRDHHVPIAARSPDAAEGPAR